VVEVGHAVRADAGRQEAPMRATVPIRSQRRAPLPGLRLALVLAWVLALVLPVLSMPAHAIEEPAYTVTRTIGEVEVRRYAPYVVAEVVVPGSADAAGNAGFRILAAYIFGENRGRQRLSMTAPVTETAAPVRLPMTAPVTQSPAAGGYRVQFVLPRGTTVTTAPVPLDARIAIREIGPTSVAVIRYSGLWSQSNYDEHLATLRAALGRAGIVALGEPTYSRYDPPFKPWFLRRNEIWLPVADAAGEPAR
jgi:SOUL heme-binding protein